MVEEAKQDAFVCLSNNPNLETFVYNDMIPGGKELDKFINSSSIATMMVGNANGPKSRGNVFRVKLRDESLSVSNFSITKDPDKYIYTVSDPDPDQNYPEYAIRLKLIGGKKYKVVPEDNKLILGDAATLTIVKNTTIGFYDAKIEIGGIVERQEPLCGYHLTIGIYIYIYILLLGRNDRDHIQLPDNEQTESISSFHLKLDYDPVTEEFTVIDWKDGTGSTYG